ncbi:MAG: transposase, partial [Clostridiales bacterium]|nr:transposase [Clostridiales bacterium]
FILKMISEDKLTAIKQYMELVNIKEEGGSLDIDFENIKKVFKLSSLDLQFEEEKAVKFNLKSLDEIFDLLDIDNHCKELLIGGSRKRNITIYKIQFIKEAIINKHTLKEIGEFLNTSQPAISNMLSYYNISL